MAFKDKDVARKYFVRYYQANKEKIKESTKQYHQVNKEKIKEYSSKPEVIAYRKKYAKQYHIENKVKLSEKQRQYSNNPEVIAHRKKYVKQYVVKNAEKISKQIKQYHIKYKKEISIKKKIYIFKRRHNDDSFRICCILRTRLSNFLKIYSKTGKIKTSNEYGINYKKIIEHLKPFPKNLSRYHIDHIVPLSFFDFNNPEEVKWAFAPENHQWLLAEENLKKGNRYIYVKNPDR